MTVYITNKSAHDFSKAKRFGQLRYVTKGRIDRYNINDMHRQALDTLKNSAPEDYIVPCSLSTLNTIVCCTFVHLHGRLNLLLFKNNDYLERNIVL